MNRTNFLESVVLEIARSFYPHFMGSSHFVDIVFPTLQLVHPRLKRVDVYRALKFLRRKGHFEYDPAGHHQHPESGWRIKKQ